MLENAIDKDIISLFVLAISNTFFVVVVVTVPYENVRKIKLFYTDCPDLKNKH